MKKYDLQEFKSEFKKKSEIKRGCCIGVDPSPELVQSFDSLEDAKKEIAKEKYRPEIRKMSNYWLVTEYFVEEYEVDEDGDFLSGSDFHTTWNENDFAER